MKFFLFTLSMLGCSAMMAQDLPKNKFPGTLPGDNLMKLKKTVDITGLLQQSNNALLQPVLKTTNGLNLMILPQDNMPCVVPDLSLHRMPNPGSLQQILPGQPGSIPNPGRKEEQNNTQ